MRPLLFFLPFAFIMAAAPGFSQPHPSNPLLTSANMRSDFAYLREKLETTHPILYIHQPRERVQFMLDSLGHTLDQPLTLLEFYKKIAFLIGEVRCEHTYCKPGPGLDSLIQAFKFLPFQLHLAGKKPIIVVNGTEDTTIKPGDEIISINGRPVNTIRQELYRYMPSDGFMTASKDHELSSMSFGLNYNLFIEQPNSYDVVVENAEGSLIRRQFDRNLSLKDINRLAMKNPVNKPVLEADKRGRKLRNQQWRLEFLNPATALLSVRTFSADKAVFKKAIDQFFKEIREKKTTHLIIDLSYNGGGEEELAAYLMSYLIDKPTRFMEAEYLITDSDSILALSNIPEEVRKNKYDYIEPLKDGKSFARVSEYARELETMQPKNNGFHARVFLYVNGVTSSAASTFAAVAQSNNRAIIVGQETAGSFRGGGAVIGLDLTLPHSRIKAHTSLLYQVFSTSGRDGNRGVIPDHEYIPDFEEMIGDHSGWKNFILQLINKN